MPNRFLHGLIIISLAASVYCLSSASQIQAEPLVIAHYRDYKPYAYVDPDGRSVGLLIDAWNLWAQKNSYEIQFTPAYLSECLEMVANGTADIMIGLFYSDERAVFLDFSNPFIDIETNVMVSTELPAKTVQELGSSPVGVIEDDFAVSFLAKNHPDLQLKTFAGSKEIIQTALAGELKAFALDFPNAMFLLSQFNAFDKFRRIDKLYTEKLRAGVRKGNTQLVESIDQGMKNLTLKDFEALYDKWGFYVPQPTSPRRPYLILAGLLLLLALGIGFGIYVRKLKTKIKTDSLSLADAPASWPSVIAKGENDQIEFKSTLRWNLKTQKPDRRLEYVVVKTISAFLNSDGGTLFIGVSDQGVLLDLGADYQSFNKKPDKDGFLLQMANIINQYLGKEFHKFITVEVETIDQKAVCRVGVVASDRPVFIRNKGAEEFYIRASASSTPLSLSATHHYISSHWSPG